MGYAFSYFIAPSEGQPQLRDERLAVVVLLGLHRPQVDLGRVDVFVAEQILHQADVVRRLVEALREGMPQLVRVHPLQASPLTNLVHELPDPPGCDVPVGVQLAGDVAEVHRPVVTDRAEDVVSSLQRPTPVELQVADDAVVDFSRQRLAFVVGIVAASPTMALADVLELPAPRLGLGDVLPTQTYTISVARRPVRMYALKSAMSLARTMGRWSSLIELKNA